jgi:hypothetical protein
MDEKPRLEILNDPVYGPNSLFFWPGTVSHAEEFALDDSLVNCRSTENFLEYYKYDYSDVEVYMENTDYPEEEYVDQLYAHFHKLYDGIDSWPYHAFFVSAFYRIVSDEIFPYQSKRYGLAKSSSFDYLNRAYLSKGLYDKAIKCEFYQSLEETQQDKEIDKVRGRISERTWYHLTRILLNSNVDPLVFKEVTRLLEQYNLVDVYFKKQLLSRFEALFACGGLVEPSDKKTFKDPLLPCLSLLRIPTEKGEQAIQRSIEEKSYGPFIDLLQTDESADFPH